MTYKVIEHEGRYAIRKKSLFGQVQFYNWRGMFAGWYYPESFHALKHVILFDSKEEAETHLKLIRGKS